MSNEPGAFQYPGSRSDDPAPASRPFSVKDHKRIKEVLDSRHLSSAYAVLQEAMHGLSDAEKLDLIMGVIRGLSKNVKDLEKMSAKIVSRTVDCNVARVAELDRRRCMEMNKDE